MDPTGNHNDLIISRVINQQVKQESFLFSPPKWQNIAKQIHLKKRFIPKSDSGLLKHRLTNGGGSKYVT